MHKKFISNLGFLILLNVIIKPVYILGIDAQVQNRVGEEDYGLYFAILNLSFIFNILIDLGINHFNNRSISRDERRLSSHFSKLLSLKAIFAIGYALLTVIVGVALGYAEKAPEMLALLVANQVMVSFILFVRSNLTATQLFVRDSIVSVIDRALLILICGALLFTQVAGGEFRIEWFVYVQSVAYFITLVLALIFLFPKAKRLRFEFDKRFARLIVLNSLPYAIFILMGSLYNRLDGLMLENLLANGEYEAGVYAQGFRYYEAAGMFAHLFPVMLMPVFARMLKEREDFEPILRMSTRLLVGGSILLAVYFLFFSQEVLSWIYLNVSETSAHSFSAMMFGFVGLTMFYTYGTLLTANANLRVLNLIAGISLSVNVILNFVLIPVYGAFGAAIATLVTQLIAGIAQWVVARRKFQLQMDKVMWRQILLFVVVFPFLAWASQNHIDSTTFSALTAAAFGLVLFGLSGAIQPKKIIQLFKSKD